MKKIITILFALTLCIGSVSAQSISLVYPQTNLPAREGMLKVTFVNQDPDPVEAGNYVTLRFKFENRGSDNVRDVVVELMEQYPFSLDPGESAVKDIGSIQARQIDDTGVIIKYRVRVDENAVDGINEIKIRYRYDTNTGWVQPEAFDVDVERKEIDFHIGMIKTEPVRLVSDTDDAKLSVELQNIGEGQAENVMTKLILPEGFKSTYSYSDEAKLGTIEGEGSKTADFYVDVDEDVAEGDYDTKLVINYKNADDDTNTYLEKELDFNIPIKATPKFEIVESKVSNAKAGQDAELRIRLKNTGSRDADSVSVRAFKESSQPFDFDEKSDFVGKLKPGQEGEAVLSFAIDKDAAVKEYLLDIEIRAIDKENVLVFDKTVSVPVENGVKSFEPKQFTGIIIIVAIVGIGLFIYSRVRKRKVR